MPYCDVLLPRKVIEAILDAGITLHVFGSSWNNCPLAVRDNLIIHPDVSYREGIKLMGQAKVALNICHGTKRE